MNSGIEDLVFLVYVSVVISKNENDESLWKLIEYFLWVPQVTLLEPILFVIYINGITLSSLLGTYTCFTEDTGIYF